MRRILTCLCVALVGCADTGPIPIDDPTAWTAHPADGVDLALSDDGGALRLDFHFSGGGYAIARRAVDLELPADYAFRFRVRGRAPSEHLEFKLVDDSGENVWWHVWRDLAWPAEWRTFTAKKRQIEFAWGPAGGGEIRHVAAIEFAVTAGSGGTGTVWIDDLQLVPITRTPGPPPAPVASASSAAPDHEPARALDGDGSTFWAAAADDPFPTLTLDLGQSREYGGLTVDWHEGCRAIDYVVGGQTEDGGWDTLQTVTGSNGGRDHLALPESESRRLRLRVTRCAAAGDCAIAEVRIQPLEWSRTREVFVANLAKDAPRGCYPRSFLDEPINWTVVGIDFDTREGLLSQDGTLESGPGGFSIEPFLWTSGRLITWNDVTATPSLADGYLPIPSVTWSTDAWRLTITALGTGEPEASRLLARYELTNTSARRDSISLLLAIRPLQVNPPSQFLNLRGGTAPITTLSRDGQTIVVDGRPRVLLLNAPDGFGATTLAGGDIVAEHLRRGTVPTAASADDPEASASAAVRYDLALAPGETAGVDLLVGLHDRSPTAPVDPDAAMAAATNYWREALNRVAIGTTPDTEDAVLTMKAQLGYILVNRAGPAIQPGARSYARSWIRDGALTGAALLRLGHADAVRDFLRWFAPHQYASGKIPCVVDARGADPVDEHDSTGEFIYLVAEYHRHTGDRATLEAMWPRVLAGVAYLEGLLDQRRTDAYRQDDLREFYGILPPSISHEGYAAKPMHSYWDDFWALQGLKDAVYLAGEMADEAEASRLAALRDRFAADLAASVAAAMQRHGIDFIPGCADLGDFDATSTTIALDPADAADILPAGALVRTFERYWEFFDARQAGAAWEAFTPYEIRNIGAFVRLGWNERAEELLGFFLSHRTPGGWRQWPEVVWHDRSSARFIGDLPHTWVGSDYIRSLLDLYGHDHQGPRDD